MLKKKLLISSCFLVAMLAGSSAWALTGEDGETYASSCTQTVNGVQSTDNQPPTIVCCKTRGPSGVVYWLTNSVASHCPPGTAANGGCGSSTEVGMYSGGAFQLSTTYSACTS